MRLNRLTYKFEGISALTGTGGQYGPDAFAPSSTLFASRALGNIAVYNNKAYGLFGQIIGRFYPWRCDKSKIGIAMVFETVCEVPRLSTVWNIVQCNIQKSVSAFLHCVCKITCSKFFGLVKEGFLPSPFDCVLIGMKVCHFVFDTSKNVMYN